MEKYRIQIVMEQDEDGKFVASCPSLPSCYTEGDTYEEATKNIQEVIELCLEELREEKVYISIDDFDLIVYEGQEGVFIQKDKVKNFEKILELLKRRDEKNKEEELFSLMERGFEFGKKLTTSRGELHER